MLIAEYEKSMKNDWEGMLDVLCAWAHERNYYISFVRGGDNSICTISKYIEINSRHTKEDQLYYLLHECGHMLVDINGSVLDVKEGRVKHASRTSTHKIFTIIEEVEAWKRGYALAGRLKIPINQSRWESVMTRALKTYVNWAAA